MSTLHDWPPPHRFRRSKKAKHINLRFIPGEGLEIVLPELPARQAQADEQTGLAAMERHKDWVLRQLEKEAVRQAEGGQPGACAERFLPESFYLHGGQRLIRLEWAHRALSMPMPAAVAEHGAADPACSLCRLKDGTEPEKRKRLRLWLHKYAENYLGARLQALAQKHGLNYRQLRIGWQKSRWGSYSSSGSIRLNAKLIFLPVELSDAVMLHELCHSLEMSHSRKFWRHMLEIEPAAREMDRRLNGAGHWLPGWVKFK